MDELKPCPFCGGKALLCAHRLKGWRVACTNLNICDVLPETDYFSTPEMAAKVWNRRANNE